MNLKEQLYVCTLAKCGTISKAAEELYISPPALSVYLSNLEKYLGVRLFERTGKSLVPTSMGREYVERAEKMLQMKEDFELLLEQSSGKCKGSLRVGIQHRRAISIAPYLMVHFLKEYPDINLIIKEGVYDELVQMYQTNAIDFLIYTCADELPDTTYVDLGEEHVLLVLPEHHPANASTWWKEGEHFPHLDPSFLTDEVFVLPIKKQSLRSTAERILEQYRIRPKRIIEIRYFETAMSMVDQGVGIGFNRSGYIQGMDRFPGVRYCLIGDVPYSARLVLAYRKGRNLAPHMERLIELIKEHINKT